MAAGGSLSENSSSVLSYICPALSRLTATSRNRRPPRLPVNNMADGDPKMNGSLVEQFANKVLDFSSEYGSNSSISYTLCNLAGPPQVYPKYGDFTQAAVFRTYGPWWQQAPSGAKPFGRTPEDFVSKDFVELQFPRKVCPTSISVYETYNPGAVVRILALVQSNAPDPRWEVLWQSSGPKPTPQETRIFKPFLRKVSGVTNIIRLEFNHNLLDYYTELDAVQLFGREEVPKNGPLRALDKSSSVDPPNYTDWSLNSTTNNGGNSPADRTSQSNVSVSTETESVVQGLSRLHLCDGLSAALEDSNNGYFDLLPVEVLQVIITYLDVQSLCRLGATSHYLQSQCNDCHQYIELDLQPYWHKVTDRTLEGFARRCHRLQRLNLSWCGSQNSITITGLTKLISSCGPELLCLRLASCNINNKKLELICETCPNLTELDLSKNSQVHGRFYGEVLVKLKNLRRLNLYKTVITDASLLSIIRSCCQLKHLNIGSLSISSHNEVAQALADHCKNLRSLDLWRAQHITDSAIKALADNCPHLEELDLGWCSMVKTSVSYVARKCPKLKKLFLTANRAVCDNDIITIADHCPLLEQLDFLGTREVSVNAVQRVLDNCKNLQMLDVSFCGGIDHAAVESWSKQFPNVNIKKSFQMD